jgi:multidrug resistance efflux pump
MSSTVDFEVGAGAPLGVRSPPAAGLRSALLRISKLGGAVGVLAVGVYALMSEQGYVVSDTAVVTTQRIVVRAPIEGYAERISTRVGSQIAKGEVLGQVDNPRVDDQRFAALSAQVAPARPPTARDSLIQLKLGLRRRVEEHRTASQARVAGLRAEAQRSLAAFEAAEKEAQLEFDRKLRLSHDGVTSAAELDKVRTALTVATERAAAQRGRLASLQAEAAAIEKGVLAESGANDVAYSMQRVDEIDLRLAELNRTIALAQAEAEAAAAQLAAEERRLTLMRSAVLTAPQAGIVWKLGASDGERLAPGDPVVETVDCGSGFILAGISQKSLSRIALGSAVHFRLAGETSDRTGHVVSVSGDRADDRGLAALPSGADGSEATARIQIANPDPKECLIGRSARVMIPAPGDGLLRQALSRLS